MSVLSCQALSVHRGGNSILKDISFRIADGDMVAVLGPNGAGKTTLFNCIAGELSPKGRIDIAGNGIQDLSKRQLAAQLAYVQQTYPQVFDLTVSDIVRMGLLPSKSIWQWDSEGDAKKIRAALSQVGLEAQHDHILSHLSGGEQQRVHLARALVQGAKILLLDEPTNHLDIYYQHEILTLIQSLGLTVLLTIHDINLALQYCSRLLLLNAGQLVFDGTPQQVLDSEVLSDVFRLPVQRWQQADALPYIQFKRL